MPTACVRNLRQYLYDNFDGSLFVCDFFFSYHEDNITENSISSQQKSNMKENRKIDKNEFCIWRTLQL